MQCPKCKQQLHPVWLDLDQGEWNWIWFSVLDMKKHKRKRGFFESLFKWKSVKHPISRVVSRKVFIALTVSS